MSPASFTNDLCVIHVFPYSANVAGGHSNAIIAFMRAQEQHGITVRAWSPPATSMASTQWRSVEHLPIQELDFRAPDLCQRAMELAAGLTLPIFHFHGVIWPFVRFARELKDGGIPYVVTSHGQLHYRETLHWAKKFLYINVATRFFRNAGGLHFLTQREERRCRYLIPGWNRPVLIQPNVIQGPDPGTISPASREQRGIPPEAFVFAYLGRLDIRHKGLDVLVKAFAKVQSRREPFLLLIGPDRVGAQRLLQRLAQRLNCAGRVRFLGPHYDESKWQLLRMADAFVSPSRWDAFPIAVAEAIGFGLPTIVSKTMNPAPEYLAAGAATVVKVSASSLSNAMCQLANEPSLRQSLSEQGRRYIHEKCSPQQAGKCFADFYLQVLQKAKRPLLVPSRPKARPRDKTVGVGINVIHVFPYSPAVSGGHSNAIRSFIACQKAQGISAMAVAPKHKGGGPQPNWDFPLFEVDSLWNLRWADIVERFAITSSNSIVNFHSVNYRFGPLQRDLLRAGLPYALTSHGQLNFRTPLHGLEKLLYLNMLDRGPRRAAGIHVLTGLASRRLNLLMPRYPGLRLIQGNVVELPNLAQVTAGSRSDYGLPPGAFVLLYLGRLDVRGKGLDLLVETYSCLPKDRFRLVLAGPDWKGGRAKLEQLAVAFGCRDDVYFPGPIYGEKKWGLLKMADLFVSPSRWEAFSVAQAEALALGLPLITSEKITLAEDLREASAALLTPLAVEPLARAICLLEADHELMATMGSRGKAWAAMHCSPDRAGILFREFYQAILQRKRATGS